MKVLLVGPDHDCGSLPPYLDVLATGLRKLGVAVDRLGSAELPFDQRTGTWWPVDRIVATARELAGRVAPGAHDLVSLHFGNLEIEQLLPAIWNRKNLPPIVHHIHALDWTLFTRHRPDEQFRHAVETGIVASAGLVFFGAYARTALASRITATSALPSDVIPLPTTVPTGTVPDGGAALSAAFEVPRADITVLTLCGFAAPWKDVAGLVTALERATAPIRVVLAGPFWDDPAQAGHDLSSAVGRPLRLGKAAELVVIPTYLPTSARAALVAGSDAGVFPYRHQATFQGSGALADYLAAGTPVIASDVANMAEMVGDAGLLVAPGRPDQLVEALDAFATDAALRTRLSTAAWSRSQVFTPAAHAAACLAFYRSLLDDQHFDPRETQRWTAMPGSSSPGTDTRTAITTSPPPARQSAAG